MEQTGESGKQHLLAIIDIIDFAILLRHPIQLLHSFRFLKVQKRSFPAFKHFRMH